MSKYHLDYVGMREEGDSAMWLLSWGAKGIGFGEVSIHFKKDGSIVIDDETMGREFVKAALCAVVDKAQLTSDGDNRDAKEEGT